MSYLIKERMMRDTSDLGDSVTLADSALAIEKNFAGRKEGLLEEPAPFAAYAENVEVVDYLHFLADNIREVWLNIFEMLDAEDKITISKTCHEIHDWVASTRTNFQFSEVVPMLAQARNLPKRELLRSRTICKSWTSSAFNCVYAAHLSYLHVQTENRGEVEENQISNLDNCFTCSEQIQGFVGEMHSHPGNPFPGRSIRLAFRPPQGARRADGLRRLREYYENAIQLLEVYGLHLHIAMFYFSPWEEPIHTYNYFRRCLLQVPNLKKLLVSGQPSWPNLGPYLNEDPAFYRQNTLPQLPHLETVCMYGMPHAIWNGVLESCCIPLNVKRLLLSPAAEGMEHLRIPEAAYFPNLEAFEVFLPIKYFERFLNVPQGVRIPPVHTVELTGRENKQDFGRVFKSLEVLGGSLTLLRLRTAFSEESLRDVIASGFVINLPQLERLELVHFNGPLDPFGQLPSLKFLTIEWPQIRQWDGSRVDFYEFEECMEESNVWEKIPSLQEFHFQSLSPRDICKTYYRDLRHVTFSLDVLELDWV